MTHLYVDLYENVKDRLPCCTLDDHDVSNRQYFHDLHQWGSANRATRIVIRPGDEYHTGDHIRLLDEAKPNDADTIVIDPAIASDVDLNEVIFDDRGFADRAGAILILTNPDPDSRFRLRVSLYDQLGQVLPSLIFYDWEYPRGMRLADLNHFHFAKKAAHLRLESGPAYQPGDRVILRESFGEDSPLHPLDPGDYDLGRLMVDEPRNRWSFLHQARSWADTLAAIELDLRPRLIQH